MNNKLNTISWINIWANALILAWAIETIKKIITIHKSTLIDIIGQDPESELAYVMKYLQQLINNQHTTIPQTDIVQAGISPYTVIFALLFLYVARSKLISDGWEYTKDIVGKQLYKRKKQAEKFGQNTVKALTTLPLIIGAALLIAYSLDLDKFRKGKERLWEKDTNTEVNEWIPQAEPIESKPIQWKITYTNTSPQKRIAGHTYTIDKNIQLADQHEEVQDYIKEIQTSYQNVLFAIHVHNLGEDKQSVIFYDDKYNKQYPLVESNISYTNKTFVMSQDEHTVEKGELRDKVIQKLHIRILSAWSGDYEYITLSWSWPKELAFIRQTNDLSDIEKRDLLRQIHRSLEFAYDIYDNLKVDRTEKYFWWEKPNQNYEIEEIDCIWWKPKGTWFEQK